MSIRGSLLIAVLLALLASPAWAQDLALEIQAENTTNITTVTYRAFGAGVVYDEATVAGTSATNAVALDITGLDADRFTLYTPFGGWTIFVDSDGDLTLPANGPLTFGTATDSDRTNITIGNAIESFDVSLVCAQASSAEYVTYRISAGSFAPEWLYAASEQPYTTGTNATTVSDFTLEGVIPGQVLQCYSTLGRFRFRLVEDGAGDYEVDVLTTAGYDAPVDLDGSTMELQNTLDVPNLTVVCDRATSLSAVTYRFRGPYGLANGYVADPVSTTGAAAAVAQDVALSGLAPGILYLNTQLGTAILDLESDGDLVERASSSYPLPITITQGTNADGEATTTIEIENTIDLDDFAVRARNETSVPTIGWRVVTGGSVLLEESGIDGEDADLAVSESLAGLTPSMYLNVHGTVGYGQLVKIQSDGTLQVVDSTGVRRVPVSIDGETVILENPLAYTFRVRSLDADDALGYARVILTNGTYYSTYLINAVVDGEDIETGASVTTDGLAVNTRLNLVVYLYAAGSPTVPIYLYLYLNDDGSAYFFTPTSSPTVVAPASDGRSATLTHPDTDEAWVIELLPPNEPPILVMPENVEILSSAQEDTVLIATVTDEDEDDTLTCRWHDEDGTALTTATSPDGSDECSLDLGELSTLAVGQHDFTLVVSDGTYTVSGTVSVTIGNSPPAVAATGDGTFECADDVTVTLGGTVADYDGDELTYTWYLGGAAVESGSVETPAGGATVALPEFSLGATSALGVGSHVCKLQVQDGANGPVSAEVVVTVIDTTAPTIHATATPNLLWPPNHSMVDVTVTFVAADNCDTDLDVEVLVLSSEPPEADGDGNFLPDVVVDEIDESDGTIDLQLRAERNGKGDGRTYTIVITVTDDSDLSSSTTLVVGAPHDRKKR